MLKTLALSVSSLLLCLPHFCMMALMLFISEYILYAWYAWLLFCFWMLRWWRLLWVFWMAFLLSEMPIWWCCWIWFVASAGFRGFEIYWVALDVNPVMKTFWGCWFSILILICESEHVLKCWGWSWDLDFEYCCPNPMMKPFWGFFVGYDALVFEAG